jgi:epsilon-lactone hydrolase
MTPSLQLRVARWYVRTFVRRESWGDPERLARRARRIFGSPGWWAATRSFGVRVKPINESEVRGEWIEPENGLPGTILYIHGGGYVAGSPATHRPVTAALARLTHRAVFSLDYRLAPEHPFPCAFDDAFAAYRWLISREDPRLVTVAGDSAGGGLALAVLIAARDAGLDLPAAAVLYSPWTDMEGSGDSVTDNLERCAMFAPSNIDDFAAAYLGVASRRDVRASPGTADLSGLPPILLQAGDTELLLGDSVRVDHAISEAGGTSEMSIYDHVFHGWQMLDGLMPESARALEESADFVVKHIEKAAAGAFPRTPANIHLSDTTANRTRRNE